MKGEKIDQMIKKIRTLTTNNEFKRLHQGYKVHTKQMKLFMTRILHPLILMRNGGWEKSNMYSEDKKQRESHQLFPEKRKYPKGMP